MVRVRVRVGVGVGVGVERAAIKSLNGPLSSKMGF